MSKSNKPKKPIYKRVWPYIVIVCLIGAGVGGAASSEPDDGRGDFAQKRTVITITPEPGEKDTFSLADIEEASERSAPVAEKETPQAPVARSAPVQEVKAEDTTQEIAEEPAEEVRAEEPEPSQNTPNSNGEHVYVSAGGGGERYHFDIDCTGGSVKEVTLEYAQTHGYTACKKCAGG